MSKYNSETLSFIKKKKKHGQPVQIEALVLSINLLSTECIE